MIYYKNEITNNLDKNYGDLAGKITDCQNATFREISKQILEFENDILNVNLFISYLDVFIHFYIISEKYELYKPNISLINDNIFNFEKGRNIITEMTLSQIQYVKNDFFSNKKDIFIIYGNVNSGKK
jgi:DNA mismatch repair ATPase MutS